MRNFVISGFEFKLIQKFNRITNKALGRELGKSEATVRNIHKLRYVDPSETDVLFNLCKMGEISHSNFKKMMNFFENNHTTLIRSVRKIETKINLPVLFYQQKNSWMTADRIHNLVITNLGHISKKIVIKMLNKATYLDISIADGINYYQIKHALYNEKLRNVNINQAAQIGETLMGRSTNDSETTSKYLFI